MTVLSAGPIKGEPRWLVFDRKPPKEGAGTEGPGVLAAATCV